VPLSFFLGNATAADPALKECFLSSLKSELSVSPSGRSQYLYFADSSSFSDGSFKAKPGVILTVTVTLASADKSHDMARIESGVLLAKLRRMCAWHVTSLTLLSPSPPPQPPSVVRPPALSRDKIIIIGCVVGAAVLALLLGTAWWYRSAIAHAVAQRGTPKMMADGRTRGEALLQAGLAEKTPLSSGDRSRRPAAWGSPAYVTAPTSLYSLPP